MGSHNTLGFPGLNKPKIDLRIMYQYSRYDKAQILVVARSDVSKGAGNQDGFILTQ